MTRKLFLVLVALLFSITTSAAYAQTITSTESAASKLEQQLQKIKSRKEVTSLKKDLNTDLKEQIIESVKLKKEEIKEATRVKREEFKTRIQTIKDEKKKVIVQRIDTKLTNVNTRHTDRFTQVLSNLQIMLNKAAEEEGKVEVQNAIDVAKLAVENQAAKTYTLTISTETSLKSDVGTITSQLRKDLVITHKLVVTAKQKLQKLRESKTTTNKEATDSINQK